jgi:ParB family chromosome partitioning protein
MPVDLTGKGDSMDEERPGRGGTFMRIDIAKITVEDTRRLRGDLTSLMESLQAVGQIAPIVVTPDYRLVVGYHRLKAAEALGWRDIMAEVRSLSELEARIATIDENIERKRLSQLEEAEQIDERKAIYETVHQETKHGGARLGAGRPNLTRPFSSGQIGHSNMAEGQDEGAPSFSDHMAEHTGKAARTVRRSVQIAQDIAFDVRDQIRPTRWADQRGTLHALARLPADQQRDLVAARLATNDWSPLSDRRAREILAVAPPNVLSFAPVPTADAAPPPATIEEVRRLLSQIKTSHETLEATAPQGKKRPPSPEWWVEAWHLDDTVQLLLQHGPSRKRKSGKGWWDRLLGVGAAIKELNRMAPSMATVRPWDAQVRRQYLYSLQQEIHQLKRWETILLLAEDDQPKEQRDE